MKRLTHFYTIALFTILISGSSCAQPPTTDLTGAGDFEGTTPCDEAVKDLLGIPRSDTCDMLKWKLTLTNNPATKATNHFALSCEYGLPKQGTRGFENGSSVINFSGSWTIEEALIENSRQGLVKLNCDKDQGIISFVKPGNNILHLLDRNNQLLVGNGAWSYTLSRNKPVGGPSNKAASHSHLPVNLKTDSLIVGIFQGRTPCNDALLSLNGLSSSGCELIKTHLVLYQNVATHTPTTFRLQLIYVGKGNTRYTNSGTWLVTKALTSDPNAIVYTLNSDKNHVSINLLRAGNNILFFVDGEMNPLPGNSYCSYTLNRTNK